MSHTRELRLIIFTFVAIAALGAFLLMLPISHNNHITITDAFFTATSAVCVTGLIVKDTPLDFTIFGQAVILIMIQIGGLGYMTVATFMSIALRNKISHREQMILKSSLNYDTLSGIVRFLKTVLKMVLLFEGIGALLLAARFSLDMPVGKALWFGLFHSLSFFNNAGFSLFSTSMMDYKFDPIINIVSTSLIIMGGVGYFVILELFYFKKKRLNRLSTHTKLTLSTTFFLIIAALSLFLTLEWFNDKSIGSFAWWEKLTCGYFYAVNLRTAGANSIDVGTLSDSTLFLSTIFMVIGGGAGGTAGGIKVTVFAIIVVATWRSIKGYQDTFLFKRTIPHTTVMQSFTILLLGSFYIIAATILISETHDIGFIKIVYEVASAFGTVGLSVGNGGVLSLSATFNDFGKSVIMLIMFAGRIGFLAFTLAFVGKIAAARYRYAEGRVII